MGLIILPNGLGSRKSAWGFEDGEGLDRDRPAPAVVAENFCTCSIHDERITRRFDGPKGCAPVCGVCQQVLHHDGVMAEMLGVRDGNRKLPTTRTERGSPAVDRMVRPLPQAGIVAAKEA